MLLGAKMRHTGNERLLKRAIIGPFRQDSVHICVVYFWLAMRIFRHGPTLPRHPRVEDPQDEVKDAMIAQFTLGSTLGGAAGKAANLVGCESPRRQLPDSDG